MDRQNRRSRLDKSIRDLAVAIVLQAHRDRDLFWPEKEPDRFGFWMSVAYDRQVDIEYYGRRWQEALRA